MSTYIALIRGINVGKAKRIAMADLRELVENLGHSEVRTLLNSGNVVFRANGAKAEKLSKDIENAIQAKAGFSAKVIVVSANELATIVQENPIPEATEQPSQFLIAFVANSGALSKLSELTKESWMPDQFAIGSKTAYVWCAGGILESKLATSVMRLSVDTATTRNWSTVLKLHAMASE